MSQRTSRLPSPALLVAVCALVVALGGTAYAVAAVPPHSIGALQLKKNAVRSVAVQNHSLKASDFAKGQLGGDLFLKNAGGETVPVTATLGEPSTVISSLELPKGKYYVRASVIAINTSAALQADLRCYLRSDNLKGVGTGGLYVPIEPNAGTNGNRGFISLDIAVRMKKKGQVTVECDKGGMAQTLTAGASIAAMTIGKLTAVP